METGLSLLSGRTLYCFVNPAFLSLFKLVTYSENRLMGTGLGFSSISSGTALPYIGSLVARGPSTKN